MPSATRSRRSWASTDPHAECSMLHALTGRCCAPVARHRSTGEARINIPEPSEHAQTHHLRPRDRSRTSSSRAEVCAPRALTAAAARAARVPGGAEAGPCVGERRSSWAASRCMCPPRATPRPHAARRPTARTSARLGVARACTWGRSAIPTERCGWMGHVGQYGVSACRGRWPRALRL